MNILISHRQKHLSEKNNTHYSSVQTKKLQPSLRPKLCIKIFESTIAPSIIFYAIRRYEGLSHL